MSLPEETTVRIIKDEKTVRGYLEKHSFQDIFSFDISPYTTVVFFDAGDEICRQDERPEYLYYIFDGTIKLFFTQRNGKTYIIDFLKAPCFIGEAELLVENTYTRGVTALAKCGSFKIDIKKCGQMLLEDPVFLRYICRYQVEKSTRFTQNYGHNKAYPLKVRFAEFILMNSRNDIYREQHTEVAEFLGVSYRHLLYVLSDFVDRGILEKAEEGYRIKNRRELEKLAQKD